MVKAQHRDFNEHFKEKLERAIKQFVSLDPLGEFLD
jgi:hypothetical protein